MYESFYGFTGKPFQLNPDPRFFFLSRQHRRAMAFVEYGLHQSEGFIVVTGEVGAGKTTVIRNLLSQLDAGKVTAATLVSTQLDADDILRMVAAAFGVNTRGLNKSDLLLSLEAHLASQAQLGRRCLLIVDEAQNLTRRAVEELRMLSNFQLGTHALLQSFLVGQPEFRHILQSPEMHQLRQRVIAACHIGPLEADDSRKYVEHRLQIVGWRDTPLITPDAFEAIHAASGGVPRRINLLCDRLLLSGFLSNRRVFSGATVKEVAEEIRSETLAAPGYAGADEAHPPSGERELGPRAGAFAAPGTPEHGAPVESELLQVKAALERVERGNKATLGVLRRFLDWTLHQDNDKDGHA